MHVFTSHPLGKYSLCLYSNSLVACTFGHSTFTKDKTLDKIQKIAIAYPSITQSIGTNSQWIQL